MAKQTFKVNVDLDSKSLSKLKKTLADARVKVDEKSISSLEDSMASLEAELDRNSEHLNVLTDAIANMGGGAGGKPSDLMGGSGAVGGGSAGILGEIRDLLEANGTRLKSLAETTEAGFNEEAHKRLKQMSISQMMLDDQLKTKRIWLRAIIGGGGSSGIMRALTGAGGALFGKMSDMAQDQFKFQGAKKEINEQIGIGGGVKSLTPDQRKGIGQNFGIKDFDKAQKMSETRMGKMLGKLGGGKGMKMAGAIGLGALGLASLAKKGFQALVESSPMLKQMMKMLNFGVMMILRPIGDFFGFLFRPILIYLLRKFIIPFYQTYLPIMQKLGTQIGEFVVGWFKWAGSIHDAIFGSEARGETSLDLQKKANELLMDVEPPLTPYEQAKENQEQIQGSDLFGATISAKQAEEAGVSQGNFLENAGDAFNATLDKFDQAYLGDQFPELTKTIQKNNELLMDAEPIIDSKTTGNNQFYYGDESGVHGITTTVNISGSVDEITLDKLEEKLDERDKKIEEKIYLSSRRFTNP